MIPIINSSITFKFPSTYSPSNKMQKRKLITLVAILVAGSSTINAAVVTLSLPTAGTLQNQSGAAIANGSLIQLVNLGLDGVFNPIVGTALGDGDVSQLGQWVSGDDSLVNVAFGNGDAGTFPTAAAFDLRDGSDTGANGVLIRDFIGLSVTSGDKFGIRWWPSITATNFSSTTLVDGLRYGQFTRQSGAQYGGILWVMPADGANELIDSFATVSGPGGVDPDSAGLANGTTAGFVPEPASALLSILGISSICAMRRRSRI